MELSGVLTSWFNIDTRRLFISPSSLLFTSSSWPCLASVMSSICASTVPSPMSTVTRLVAPRNAVAMTVPGRILGVALRQCPGLPPTIAERIKDYRAQNVADWVMYRQALAAAAEARGWAVHWYDAKKVFDAASEALRIEDLDAHFLQLRRSIGSPWGKDHKIAMAVAIVAGRAR